MGLAGIGVLISIPTAPNWAVVLAQFPPVAGYLAAVWLAHRGYPTASGLTTSLSFLGVTLLEVMVLGRMGPLLFLAAAAVLVAAPSVRVRHMWVVWTAALATLGAMVIVTGGESPSYMRDFLPSALLLTLTAGILGGAQAVSAEQSLWRAYERERRREEAEGKYRALFEANKDGIALADAETGVVVDCNPALLALVGRRREDVVGQSQKVLHPPQDGKVTDGFRRHVDRTSPPVMHTRLVTASGEVCDVEVKSSPIELNGRPHLIGVFRDLTDRHQAAAALSEAVDRFRQLAESIHQAFWLRELSTGLGLYVSPAFNTIWGRPPDFLDEPGAPFLQTAHPDDAAIVADAVAAMDRQESVDVEFRIVRPDQTIRSVHARTFLVRDASGRPIRLAGIAEDVTARRQAAEALRVSEAQLRQAQKLKAIGQLAGGIAHDFNNLLTVIIGASDLLLEDLHDHPARQSVLEIAHAATRASELTTRLLVFSRRQALQPRRLALNAVLGRLGWMLRRVIGEDLELVTDLGADLHEIAADPGQLEQVVLNLANNARDAMPRGGRLTLRTAAGTSPAADAEESGTGVVLEVSDTGCGMSPETAAHLFEPFFTTKPVGKGTGLGLAMVYGTMSQIGGRVEVETAVGRGTTFRLFFPTAGLDVPAPTASPRAEPVGRGSETILVVDDEFSLRNIAQVALERHGYRVLTATDGEDALGVLASSEPIDLVLTDVIMPRMGGHDLSRRVRDRWPSVRVLLMSGYDHRASPEAGVVIQKPFSTQSLLGAVRRALDDCPSTSMPPPPASADS
jgi:two-component system, cell cycle sensor histidine kinase and response regulator CckA